MRRHWIDCCRMDPNYRSTPLHSVLFVVYISFHVDCLLLAADLLFILETSAWRHIRIPAKSAQTSPVWSACVSSSVGTNVRRPLNGSTAQQLSGRVLCAPLPLSIRIMYCIHCRWKGKGEAIWPISIDTFGVATHYERAHKFFSLFFHYFSYFFFILSANYDRTLRRAYSIIADAENNTTKKYDYYWCVCARTRNVESHPNTKEKSNGVFHSFQFSLWIVSRPRKSQSYNWRSAKKAKVKSWRQRSTSLRVVLKWYATRYIRPAPGWRGGVGVLGGHSNRLYLHLKNLISDLE